jgi:2-isopropylmalate synthase
VNGIGERAGNTSLEEVVMAMRTRPDVYAGLDTAVTATEIYPSSRLLASTIGVAVQPNKAIVGDNAFAHEAGIHQDGVLKAAITYEIMTPQSIGRASNELVMGKHSGRHAFRERLAELGFELEGEAFQEAFRRFKDLADAKKTIFNEDLEAIASDAAVRTDERFALKEVSVLSGTFAKPTATVELLVDRAPAKATSLGIGPVDAVFKAIAQLTETKSELERFHVSAITGGMDALGEVSVTVAEDGRRVIGNGADPDIIVASARAYVHALNKLEWHKRRHSVAEPKGI